MANTPSAYGIILLTVPVSVEPVALAVAKTTAPFINDDILFKIYCCPVVQETDFVIVVYFNKLLFNENPC